VDDETEPLPLVCSAKDCQQPAIVALRWNNPKIHEPDRRKTWLACRDHQESLTSFLGARGFMRETELVGEPRDTGAGGGEP
jgi:hypothetical protein